MFKTDPNLFFSASNSANNGKNIINECKRILNEMLLEDSDFVSCKNKLNSCDVNGLVDFIDEIKANLLKVDKEFSDQYMALVYNEVNIGDLSSMSADEQLQYSLSARDFSYTMLARLEQLEEEGKLTPEMQKQLELQREIVAQYEISDKMSSLASFDPEYEKLYNQNFEHEKNIITLNPNLTEEEKTEALKQLELGYNEVIKKIKESQKNKKDNDELNQLIKDKEENSGFWHPFVENELNEAIINKKIDMGIASEDEIKYINMNGLEKTFENTKTFLSSTFQGLTTVGETLMDGAVMLGGKVGICDKDWASDFVNTNYAQESYDYFVRNSDFLNSSSAYSQFHNMGNVAGSTLGYVALSYLPGGAWVTAAAGGLSAMGSSSQRALNSGVTFDEAFNVGAVSGIVGAASGYGIGKFNSIIKTSTKTLTQVGSNMAIGGAISTLEPIVNSGTEYLVYANEMVDENGNKMYDNVWDYYVEGGGWDNTKMAFTIGAISSGASSLGGYKTNAYKQDFNSNMNALDEAGRSKAWEDYYKQQYGVDSVEHMSGVGVKGRNGSFVDPKAKTLNYIMDATSGKGSLSKFYTPEQVYDGVKKFESEYPGYTVTDIKSDLDFRNMLLDQYTINPASETAVLGKYKPTDSSFSYTALANDPNFNSTIFEYGDRGAALEGVLGGDGTYSYLNRPYLENIISEAQNGNKRIILTTGPDSDDWATGFYGDELANIAEILKLKDIDELAEHLIQVDVKINGTQGVVYEIDFESLKK